MCGFTGFVGKRRPQGANAAIAEGMALRISHRGPDDSGVWTDEESGVALAHRRLSIVDLSAAGHQPMTSASGRWVLVYNGEVYNHFELRARLESAGAAPSWRGHSDTETLLAGFDAWGVDATLRLCVGMFAFAMWDRKERAIWLARDRIGEKPLYYGWQGDSLLFGSELKALRAHPDFRGEVDRGALSLLLRHNYVPSPYSIHKGIGKLPPGTWLRIGQGQRDAVPVAYWSFAEVAEHGVANPFFGSDADAVEALDYRMGVAVNRQLMADVPLGALLSGGIDSTAVTAVMQANSSQAVRTYTVGFEEEGYDEAVHARAIASHLGTNHTEMRLGGGDALALVPRLADMYDEPFADSSQLPTHLVMRMAREHVTVVLSGDGADELFGGYNRYLLGPKAWSKIRWIPRFGRSLLGRGMTAVPAAVIDKAVGRFPGNIGMALPGDKLHKLGSRLTRVKCVDDLYVSLVSEWADLPHAVLDGSTPVTLLDDRGGWPRLQDPVARMMALDTMTYLPDDILVKVDRASMAVSLEARAPYLDKDLVEFASSLPMHMKLRHGKGKWLMRQLLGRYVPDALMNRPKMGFGVPLDQWLRGPLRDWAESLLDRDRLRQEGYFDPGVIRDTWSKHLAGNASFGYRLWSVLMFQAWLERQRGLR